MGKLQKAAASGDMDAVTNLVYRMREEMKGAMYEACERGDVGMVGFLLRKGGTANNTLSSVAVSGNVPLAKFLFSMSNPDKQNYQDALAEASTVEMFEFALSLMKERDEKPDLKWCLETARKRGNEELVKRIEKEMGTVQ